MIEKWVMDLVTRQSLFTTTRKKNWVEFERNGERDMDRRNHSKWEKWFMKRLKSQDCDDKIMKEE